jgi:FG-GAP-like repeat
MSGAWTTRGFEAFRRGSFGDAGKNLYVSRAGVLQRIHCFDLNGDGYVDLPFCNSQEHWETPPTYVYQEPLLATAPVELNTEGARCGTLADLNGDGYDDLVLGMYYNGARKDLNAYIYYGSPQGLTEARRQLLPAPACTAVAAGDFDGDGRPDLAFLCAGKLRIFYQTMPAFEPKQFVDLEIVGEDLAAHDLDGDGYADLVVRQSDGQVKVYWGGPAGIMPGTVTTVPIAPEEPQSGLQATLETSYLTFEESMEDARPFVKVLQVAKSHQIGREVLLLFVARSKMAYLVPALPGRAFGPPIALPAHRTLSAAIGDADGDGYNDLVLACREQEDDREYSWIFWGGPDGFTASRTTRVPSQCACDVALADLNGDGRDEIVLCQHHDGESYTTHSLVYRVMPDRSISETVRLVTHDARRVLVSHAAPSRKPQIIFVNAASRRRLGDLPISIYLGGPDGFCRERRWTPRAWGAVDALYCDLNDDGYADLIVANASENSVWRDPGSYVYLNGPNGLAAQPDWRLPTSRAMSVACGDLNHDGYLDLVFCGFCNPELLVFYGGPDGLEVTDPVRVLLDARDGHLLSEPRTLHLADLNNDGWLDLFIPDIVSDRSPILWGGPDGFNLERHQRLSVRHACCARTADLTGNGYLDLLVGGHQPSQEGPHDSYVYIYWNGPGGLREDNRALLPANAVNCMTLADFNNDGRPDLFVGSYHGVNERDIDSYIYWNRSGRGFSATDRTRLFTHSASGVVAADFNEDGWVDLAIAYHKVWGDHVGFSTVWWNSPDGFSEQRVTKLPTSGPHGMISAEPRNSSDGGETEFYTSCPHLRPEGSRVTQISWLADVPAKTWVRAQLRSAPSEHALDEAPWQGAQGVGSWFENGDHIDGSQFGDLWIQYRLALGAVNSGRTPRVREVVVSHTPGPVMHLWP